MPDAIFDADLRALGMDVNFEMIAATETIAGDNCARNPRREILDPALADWINRSWIGGAALGVTGTQKHPEKVSKNAAGCSAFAAFFAFSAGANRSLVAQR
ncbi:MAG TPA: hypothetical protein VMB85_13840, partial [Bryobacteraceae bacterium]|nr:hypothetical protein [Bryobacteraceae bacterium]